MKLPPAIAKPWWVNLYEYHGPWERNDKFVKARQGYGTTIYLPGYNNNTDYLLFHRDFIRWIDDDTFMGTRGPGIFITASDGFEKPRGGYWQILVEPDSDQPVGMKIAPAGFQETIGVIVRSTHHYLFPSGSKWVAIRGNLIHLLGDRYVANLYSSGNNYYTIHGIPEASRYHQEDAMLYRYA